MASPSVYPATLPARLCEQCGIPLQRRRHPPNKWHPTGRLEAQKQWQQRRFCSSFCAHAWRREDRRPEWKGDAAIPASDDDFWAKVDKNGPLWNGTSCWLWLGTVNAKGYGTVMRYIDGVRKHLRAHRYAYMLAGKPLPAGLTLDHLCRVRHCVNPLHLDPVPSGENTRRGKGRGGLLYTHCPKGHERTSDNLIMDDRGAMRCRICFAEKRKRYRNRERNKAPVPCANCGTLCLVKAKGLCNRCYSFQLCHGFPRPQRLELRKAGTKPKEG